MKVDLVSYVDPRIRTGGGELAMRVHLEEAARRGHVVRHTHRFPRFTADCHQRPDVTIMADVWNLPGHWSHPLRRIASASHVDRAATEYRDRVRRVIDDRRFVHYDNAYVDVCRQSYLPCNGKMLNRDVCLLRNQRCRVLREQTRPLYERSIVNCFVSPLHQQVVLGMVGPTASRGSVVRPLLDPASFSVSSGARDIPLLYAGPLVEAKGAKSMIAHPRAREIVGVGPAPTAGSTWLGTWLGYVAPSEMPKIYARAREFIFLPRWPEPQGRVVVEAALSGCLLHVNSRVGALSFDLPPDAPALSRGASAEWWTLIEELARS